MDEDTLDDDPPVEHQDREVRRARRTSSAGRASRSFVDLMMGLPGSTTEVVHAATCSTASTARCRCAIHPTDAARQQPDERPRLPRRAPDRGPPAPGDRDGRHSLCRPRRSPARTTSRWSPSAGCSCCSRTSASCARSPGSSGRRPARARPTSTSGCAARPDGHPDRWPLIQILTSLVPAHDGAARQLGARLRRGTPVPRLGDRRRRRLRARHRAAGPARAVAEPRSGAPRDARAHPRLRRLVPRHARGQGVAPIATSGPSSSPGSTSTGRRSSRSTIPARSHAPLSAQHRTARLRVELGVRVADPPAHSSPTSGPSRRSERSDQRDARRPVPQVRRRHISHTNG